jgi:hypothetical protein
MSNDSSPEFSIGKCLHPEMKAFIVSRGCGSCLAYPLASEGCPFRASARTKSVADSLRLKAVWSAFSSYR